MCEFALLVPAGSGGEVFALHALAVSTLAAHGALLACVWVGVAFAVVDEAFGTWGVARVLGFLRDWFRGAVMYISCQAENGEGAVAGSYLDDVALRFPRMGAETSAVSFSLVDCLATFFHPFAWP